MSHRCENVCSDVLKYASLPFEVHAGTLHLLILDE